MPKTKSSAETKSKPRPTEERKTHFDSRNVLIVEDDTLVGMALKSNLEKQGHHVIGQVSTADQARELYREQKPDLVLMDIRLDGADGIELAAELLAERRCPMIVISAYSDGDLIERAADAGVYGYLIKPASPEALTAQIEVATHRFAETEKLQEEKATLVQTLEIRKLTERAKGILMKRTGLSEDEAHRRLQQESQKRRVPLPDIARKIIESEELLSGQ